MDHDSAIVLAYVYVAGQQEADVPGDLQSLVGQLGVAGAQDHVRLNVGADLGPERAAVVRDIVIGLLIAGAVAAWVPNSFWQRLFLTSDPGWAKVWGPIIGPVVSILSFVCSIGNVPLAGVLWNGGISFGGVVSFIFADLLIIPILVIYRKYYGLRMTLFIAGTFYVTMVLAGYAVELLFGGLGLIPTERHAKVVEETIKWNYTTALNIVFLVLAAGLIYRFLTTDGIPMLRMMGGGPDDRHDHHHHDHHAAGEAHH